MVGVGKAATETTQVGIGKKKKSQNECITLQELGGLADYFPSHTPGLWGRM